MVAEAILRDAFVALVTATVRSVVNASEGDVNLVNLQTQPQSHLLELIPGHVGSDRTTVLVVVFEALAVHQHLVGLGFRQFNLRLCNPPLFEKQCTQFVEKVRVVGVGLGVTLAVERFLTLALFGLATLLSLALFLVTALNLALLTQALRLHSLAARFDFLLFRRLSGSDDAGFLLRGLVLRGGLGLGFALAQSLRGCGGLRLVLRGLVLRGGLSLGFALAQSLRGCGGLRLVLRGLVLRGGLSLGFALAQSLRGGGGLRGGGAIGDDLVRSARRTRSRGS